MDVQPPDLSKVLFGAITALGGVVGVLWKALTEARKEADEWRTKWAEEVKGRSHDSELFVRALGKLRYGSSDTPVSNPTKSLPASTRSEPSKTE